MAGLVPAIHAARAQTRVSRAGKERRNELSSGERGYDAFGARILVDGRDKPGHDTAVHAALGDFGYCATSLRT